MEGDITKVITYGTFDTFHYGHVELLNRARQLGDYLVVAVSTDEFNKIKGKTCMFSYKKRVEWVNSLKSVNEVIAEESWEQKHEDVTKHDIDVFVMGDDWIEKFDFLNKYCKVVYLKRTDNISSTDIKRIQKKNVYERFKCFLEGCIDAITKTYR